MLRSRQTMLFRSNLSVAAFAMALASCTPAPIDDPFDDTGELIALSGGDAGPQAACHTCHGLDGGGDGALVPRIAGMDTGYLVRQLGFYADGQRSHPQMTWLAGRLNSEERLAVSAYYAAMDFPEGMEGSTTLTEPSCEIAKAYEIYHAGLPERALSSCASCHGETGLGSGGGNPPLIGQSAEYHAEQLRRWRNGERYGDALNVMHDAASKLQESEISPLAAYIAYGPEPSRRLGFPEECP
ncbi:MAG: cytochrome c553 [Afipia broomeae]|jgi:cytochrome c553|uniref:c-type cytochrome n=2 Tax=Sphingomonadales TaxID=204457 RepID=UPI000AD74535|nr:MULTISPECIES: c-type cytochrome [Erythrobacteraceae]MBL4717190.1 c-type cytochrome [Erythrobacter sp.]MCD1592132.1 c-type cytochrome [Qipengyuania citrea]MCP2017656.1 cytochrome c553 [Qipengyuania citrea]MCZ4264464.1 c-type cytochrome [Erythrobacter sp. G21629-S1]|tara:strand:- start:289 stop:1011 length:723 start_codon:yes stop_codon:yes gene_type:complete